MSIERVKAYFRAYGLEENIQEFEVSSATVQLAAEALHCEPQRIAKTLSFMINGDAVLVVTAGDAKIDNAKYKANLFGGAQATETWESFVISNPKRKFPHPWPSL